MGPSRPLHIRERTARHDVCELAGRKAMASLERLKILIVDDNQYMINVVKTILRCFGAKDLHEATNAADAITLLKNTAVDLIITDFAMGEVNGCDLTQLIRRVDHKTNRFVAIIMLSAYAERSNIEKAREAGVTEFCAKPVTPSDLYRKICAIVNSPRPFVRTEEYFGPDRRRHKNSEAPGEERRGAATGLVVS